MDNNDILRRFRYALDLSDKKMIEAFGFSKYSLEKEDIRNLLKKPEDEGFVKCSNKVLGYFLDGFIIQKRGVQKPNKDGKVMKPEPLTSNNINNAILRKIKIALNLKTEDMVAIWEKADIFISNSDVTALFRRKDHKNYKECYDKFLRTFLMGLAKKYRRN